MTGCATYFGSGGGREFFVAVFLRIRESEPLLFCGDCEVVPFQLFNEQSPHGTPPLFVKFSDDWNRHPRLPFY